MNRRLSMAAVITGSTVAALVMSMAAAAPSALAGVTRAGATRPAPARVTRGQQPDVKNACAAAKPGHERCLTRLRTDVHGGLGVRGRAARAKGETAAADTALPYGYGPADLRAAYSLPSAGGSGQTVAIVDAYDDPTAGADLAVYRATYGLPACTSASGCFTKVNEEGQQGSYPVSAEGSGWQAEESLDLDLVSAACPGCRILLVEASTSSDADLGAAENTAASLGATEISNSYGGDEGFSMLPYMADYSHPGVAITAATGDTGFRVPSFPAVAPTVIAVSGTTLTRDASAPRGFDETAWYDAGSGCSAWVAKPAWQTAVPDCPGRVTGDVSAAALTDQYGWALYTSTDSNDGSGWLDGAGTSASSPIIAGIIGLAGNPAALPDASYLYSHASGLYDITSGYNGYAGFDCGGDNLCNAQPGYDGPTGLGTPDGISAF